MSGRTYYDFTVPIKLFAVAASNTTVNISIDGTSTAVTPADYQLLANSITIAAGAQTGSVILRIFDDHAIENLENIVLKITGSTNNNNTFIFSIVDNDSAPSGTPITIYSTNFDSSNGWQFSNFGGATANSYVIGANGGTCTTGNSLYVTNNTTTKPNAYNDIVSSPLALRTINATGKKTLSAIFDYKVGGVSGADYGQMVYRPNQTALFSILSGFYNKNNDACITQTSVPLPASLDNANFDIGFNFPTAASNGNPAPTLTIDNFRIDAAPTPIATTLNQSVTEYLGPNSTVYFVPNPGEVIVKIENLTAHDYGLTTMTIDRAGTASVQNAGGTYKYASKSVLITPTNNNPTGSYKISLFYTQAEKDGWVTSSGMPLANIKVLKSPGTIAAATDVNTAEGVPTVTAFGTGFSYQAQFNSGFSGFTIGARNATQLAATASNQVNVKCKGANTGSVIITPSGGLAPYTITPAQTNLTVGLKTFTVTDAQNNTATVQVTITEPALALAATSTQINVSCKGGNNGSVNFTPTGGTAPYTITPAQTGLAAGTYNFTITDANLCTIIKSITISEPALPLSATSTQVDVSCKGGSDGMVTFTPVGGTAPYTISPVQNNLAAGTNIFTVTDANLCTIQKSITITEPALPLTATLTDFTDVECLGTATGSVVITAAGGTAPYTISPVQNGLIAGNYTFTITDAKLCTSTVDAVISPPDPIIISSTLVNIPINTSTLLSANCGTLATKWYDATETNLLFTGNDFTTPSLSVNTIYKVRCESANCANPFTSIAVNIILANGQIVSVKSGNWEDASTWDANRVPVPTDNVLIETGHLVTIFTNTATAKTVCFKVGGELKFINNIAKLTLVP